MTATAEDVARYTTDGTVIRKEDTALHDIYPTATGMPDDEIEMFFDDPDQAEDLLEERLAILGMLPRAHEAVEFDETLGLGTSFDILPAAPRIRVIDNVRGIDALAGINSFALSTATSDRYSVELAELPNFTLAQPPVVVRTVRYISPTGTGAGSSWADAAPLSAIRQMIQQAAAGAAAGTMGEVWLRADQGNYPDTTRNINAGGSLNSPVIIRGVNGAGQPAKARIVGTRVSPYVPGGAGGNSSGTFLLLSGADNLIFEQLHFENCGLGCIRVGGPIKNLTVRDVTFNNVREFFANTASGSSGGGYATIDGLTMQRCTGVGFSKRFMRVQYASRNILIEDCVGDSDRQDRDNFASGIVFDHVAHDIIVRRCTMGNIIDTLHRYQNGDGFAGERGNYNILLEDCNAHHITDGGYDFKSDNIILRRCVSEFCHRGFRFWGLSKLINCVSRNCIDNAGENPYAQGHFNVFQNGMCELIGCRAEDTSSKAPVFRAEVAGILSIDSTTTWSVPSGTTLRYMESANSGKSAGLIIDRPTDGVPPVIQTPGVGLSLDENKNGLFPYAANKPSQLRVLDGPDVKQFSTTGTVMRMGRQDYEENPNPRRVNVGMIDGQGLWSVTQQQFVTINDVADDPITPAILLADGVTGGCWLEVAKQYCWQDVAGTIPCTDGSPCARIDDRFGFGNFAYQPDPNLVGVYRDDGNIAYIDMDNSYYLVGQNGSMNFAQVTAVMAQRRDDVDKDVAKYFLAVGKSGVIGSANNLVWELRVSGGQFLNLRIGSDSDGSQAGGPVSGVNTVVSCQTKPTTGRNNGAQIFDGADHNTLSYPFAGSLVVGASANRTGNMLGRLYGLVVTNRTETSDGTNTIFRIERQLGLLCNLDI